MENNDEEEEEEESEEKEGDQKESNNNGQEKQKKFLNFILHLSERSAVRRWREQTFGVGADPRLALLYMEGRDEVRAKIYQPVIDHRKNLRIVKSRV